MKARRVIAVPVLIILLAACTGSSSDEQLAKKPVASRDTAVVVGHYLGDPIIKYLHGDRVLVDLARIETGGCDMPGPQFGDATQATRRMTPVGTRVRVVRSKPLKQAEWVSVRRDYLLEQSAFIFPDNGRKIVSPRFKSFNERLVDGGWSYPDPYVGPSDYFASRVSSVRTVARQMSSHDFRYWLRFHRAFMRAWEKEKGSAGICYRDWLKETVALQRRREIHEAQRREAERQWREDLRWLRHWESQGGRRSCDGDGDGVCYE